MKKDKVIIIRIDPDLKFKANVKADNLDIPLSEYIRNLIINDLNKKNGNK